MNDNERAAELWHGLNNCKNLNSEVAISTVTHWLEYHGAGFPDVPLMRERIRDDASLWALSATPVELEAYIAAAIIALEGAPITNKAAKRLALMGWSNMAAEDKDKFKDWVNGQ